MLELVQPFFSAPVLPATLLLMVMVAWSLLTILIGFGADVPSSIHFHNPFSGILHTIFGHGLGASTGDASHGFMESASETLGAVALAPIKWLNLRSVPFIVWLGVFSVSWWTVSLVWWLSLDDWLTPNPGFWATIVLILRNLVCTIPVLKLVTNPMQGWFKSSQSLESKSLIGSEVEICSYEATPESGQAKYKTDSAPLLLNVRTDGPHLPKGSRAWITHYDSKKRIYQVSPTSSEFEFSTTEQST